MGPLESRVGAAILEELLRMSYASSFWNVKMGKITFGLGVGQHRISNKCLER